MKIKTLLTLSLASITLLSGVSASAKARGYAPYYQNNATGSAPMTFLEGINDHTGGHVSHLKYYVGGGKEDDNIVLPAQYIRALKYRGNVDGTKKSAAADTAVNAAIPNGYLDKVLHFHASDADFNQPVSITNLTPDQRRTLSVYTINLINHIRKQFKTPMIHMNKIVSAFSTRIVQHYIEDGFDYTHDGHDNKAINLAAKEFGLEYDKSNREQWYEDLSSGDDIIDGEVITNMATAKARIYFSIANMLLDDAGVHNNHAISISGTANTNNTVYYGDAQYDSIGNFHIIQIYDYQANKKLRKQLANSTY